MGCTAQDRHFRISNEVIGNKSLIFDVFATISSKPNFDDVADQGGQAGDACPRILDQTRRCTDKQEEGAWPEDAFEKFFRAKATRRRKSILTRPLRIALRHDKCLIVLDNKKGARKVLTGVDKILITGFYVKLPTRNRVRRQRGRPRPLRRRLEFDVGERREARHLPEISIANKTFSLLFGQGPRTDITFYRTTRNTAR